MKLFSRRQLERAAARVRTPAFAACRRRLHAATEEFLALDLEPPAAPAGYYHDYFCPEHAVELQFDPRRPRHHRCPVDGRLLRGERYDAAWRFGANLLLAGMAERLALRWRLDGDPRCLRRGRAILAGYARRYPRHPPGAAHTDSGAGRGKATYQSLDEANLIVRLARCYDLLAEGLDDACRRLVEADLLAPALAHLRAQRFYRLHNIECWHVAALVAAASLTGDAAARREALHGEFGFRHQLAAGVRSDGLWWEGSSSYHYYALAALLTTAAFVRAQEPGWAAPPRLRAMLTAPLALVLPDGRLPATNDCWASSSLFGAVCHGVPPAAALYEMAAGWWPGEPAFPALLTAAYRRAPRDSTEALLYGPERVAAGSAALTRPRSGLLPASGYAVLRSPGPLAEQSLLLLKYGPHGGAHGHPDKLAILLYARGAPAAPDLGSQGYGIDLHRGWYRQTASHNTVLVAGQPQPPARGCLHHFGPPPGFAAGGAAVPAGAVRRAAPSGTAPGYAHPGGAHPGSAYPRGADRGGAAVTIADAAVSWSGSAAGVYDGVSMRRVVAWRASYFLDCFSVRCPAPQRLDWLLYVAGELQAAPAVQPGTAPDAALPAAPGWEHVTATASGAAAAAVVTARWELRSGGGLELLLPDEAACTITVGEAPGNPAGERLQALIRTRTARVTCFVAVMCPAPGAAGVRAARRFGSAAAPGLEVIGAGGRVDRWLLPGAGATGADGAPGATLQPIP